MAAEPDLVQQVTDRVLLRAPTLSSEVVTDVAEWVVSGVKHTQDPHDPTLTCTLQELEGMALVTQAHATMITATTSSTTSQWTAGLVSVKSGTSEDQSKWLDYLFKQGARLLGLGVGYVASLRPPIIAGGMAVMATEEIEVSMPEFLTQAQADLRYSQTTHAHTEIESRPWRFNTATALADPGSGRLSLNATPPNAATSCCISNIDDDGADVGPVLRTLRVSDTFRLRDRDDVTRWSQFTISAAPVDQGAWVQLSLTWTSDSAVALAPTNNQNLIAVVARAGHNP